MASENSFFERHPKKTMAVFLLFLGILLFIAAEIILRIVIPYNIGFYTAVKKEGLLHFPYGEIYINSHGFPDDEFNLDSERKRIGYFGDSITYGVGAGRGYRYSDLLEEAYPRYEHWTFANISNGLQDSKMYDLAKKYDLDTVIYAFNLNDIVPLFEKKKVTKQGMFQSFTKWFYKTIDRLRGKSYVYNAVRTGLKNVLTKMGLSHTGFMAAEFFPRKNEELIKQVAGRINAMRERFEKEGITFCMMIIPYEMQISNHAAQAYADIGIQWEDGFLNGSTQTILRSHLRIPHLYNGIRAFQGLRDTAKVGELFVYNKGDKIDFNHPNRDGHALIAEDFANSRTCPVF